MSWDDDDMARDKDDPWRGSNYSPNKEDDGGHGDLERRSRDLDEEDGKDGRDGTEKKSRSKPSSEDR